MKKSIFKILTKILIISVLIFWMGCLKAQIPQIDRQYIFEIPVSAETENERNQAFNKALEQILIKNSNNQEVTKLPDIKAAMTNSVKYVQSYTYITPKVIPKVAHDALYLQIKFDKNSIDNLLKSKELSKELKSNYDTNHAFGKLKLRITGVNNLDQYNKAIKYLKTFNQIVQIDSSNISGSEVELILSTQGDQKTLLAAMHAQ